MLNNTCGQDCVCLIAPYPYNPNQPEDFDRTRDMDITGRGLMWFARPQLFFNAHCVPPGCRPASNVTWRCPWYFSARLSRSISRHNQSCSATEFRCFTTLQAAAGSSPVFTSARQAMSWAVCRCFHASSPATSIRHSPTASAVVKGRSRTPVRMRATAADSMSSALGCGAMGGASHARYLWLMLRPGGGRGCRRLGDRQQRR